MMVGGTFAIDDELRLLILMASNRALAALAFSHIICRLDMLHVIQSLNPIRPDFFSDSPGMGGGGELRSPDAKNPALHQPIEMKLGMSHCGHKAVLIQNLSVVALLVLEI